MCPCLKITNVFDNKKKKKIKKSKEINRCLTEKTSEFDE